MADEAEESRNSRDYAKNKVKDLEIRVDSFERQIVSWEDAYRTKSSEVERMIKEAKAEAEAEANSYKESLLKCEQDHEELKELMRAAEQRAAGAEEQNDLMLMQIDTLRADLEETQNSKNDINGDGGSLTMAMLGVRVAGEDRYGAGRERKRSNSRNDEFREGENKRWLNEGESVFEEIDSQKNSLPSCAVEAQARGG